MHEHSWRWAAAMAIGGIAAAAAHAQTETTATLLDDDFGALRPGLLAQVVGAHTEYHYLPEAARKGNWVISTFGSGPDTQRAWRVVEADSAPAMQQACRNKHKHYHPMIIAGDAAWGDYSVRVQFTPASDAGQSGLVFRYRNDRCYYFFGVDGRRAVLKMVRHATAFRQPDEKILATRPLSWSPGKPLQAVVHVKGSAIRAELPDGPALTAEDDTYARGQIGLTADVPTLFHRVTVRTDRAEQARIHQVIASRQCEEAALQAANPQPVVWRRINTSGFGVGRNVRFGDLDGDGTIDVLLGQVRHHGPKDCNSELACLTAMTYDGKRLWQIGSPDPWADHLTNDVGFQIHDWDGDGRTEVVYCMNMQMIVADGATGQVLRKAPTPATPANTRPPYNKFPRILGDALYFCDLRGTGRDADLIIKDRYLSLWALDDQLQLLWHAQCTTGHYPYAVDVDNDGKDELMMGYTLFDDDGTKRWSLDDRIQDHADGVALVRFKPHGPLRLLCAASDEGMFFADADGNILKHHYLGHVQNPAIADFRPDLPGLESVSINFWGNQGIVHFYDADGEVYHDFEPCQHGSMCLPVNWTGGPGEFFVLSADVRDGGLFDGWGRRVVTFPADGHPDMCNAVLDITGDCRDEIVVWDPYEMWVYTQADQPKTGRWYKPERSPLYNYSNYQTTVSLPGWTAAAE